MSTNELKTVSKALRKLSTYEVRRTQRLAAQAGDTALASHALAELRRRGR